MELIILKITIGRKHHYWAMGICGTGHCENKNIKTKTILRQWEYVGQVFFKIIIARKHRMLNKKKGKENTVIRQCECVG